jgi:hypothetical protein
MDAVRIVNRIAGGRDLVLEHFAVFSRFEYALKRSGMFRRSARGVAEADWDSYANELRGRFRTVRKRAFRDAVAFLLAEPPRKQTVNRHGELAWIDSRRGSGESDEQFILRLVRTVRNNLFHGGKYPNGPEREIARNQALLEATIVILNECLELHQPVRNAFAR